MCLRNAVAGVHDGYVLTKSVSRSPVGGRLLNSCLQKAMEARGSQLRPRQTFKRVEKKGFPGEFDVSGVAGALGGWFGIIRISDMRVWGCDGRVIAWLC